MKNKCKNKKTGKTVTIVDRLKIGKTKYIQYRGKKVRRTLSKTKFDKRFTCK